MKIGSKFIRLFSLLTIFTLIILMAVASTFSWYSPTSVTDTGNALYYNIEGKINRNSGCKFLTYQGSKLDGLLIYNEFQPLRGPQSVLISSENDVAYYKTIIANDNNGPAMISLYVNSISCTDGEAYVGISSPEKTYVKADGNLVCIEDNLVIPNEGTVEVYWYVGAKTGATVTFGDLLIEYN